MNPSEKGWITKYIKLLTGPQKAQIFHDSNDLDDEKSLYKLVQPTGLMYGHPIRPSRNYDLLYSKWTEHDKMKFILLDSLINNSLLIKANEIKNHQDLIKTTDDSISAICGFYDEKSSSISRNKKSETDHLETVLSRRVGVKSTWSGNFWTRYFQNSLLFLDVYFFGQWLQMKDGKTDMDDFGDQLENLRLNILQVIAKAAHSDYIIQKEEKALFKFFLQSAGLKKEKQKAALEYLKSDLKLEDIDFSKNDSWIIRKYILELAILTIWADRQVEESEKDFVRQLANHLGFSDDELESSLLAIESFVISNWKQVHFLQKRHDLLIVKDRFLKRISLVVNKNKNALVQEMKESKELMLLLHKMTRENLTELEKSKVKAQLIDVLKTLPTFVIIALPGTFITLPVLLKILPKSAFPSAFSDVD